MSTSNDVFPVSMFDNIRQHPSNYRLLTRIPLTEEGVDTHFPIELNSKIEGDTVKTVVFLDTETTGREHTKDEIIELGMVKATFSVERKIILSVDKFYDEFEQPQNPIPPEITKLTGITDEMVAGRNFNEEQIVKFLAGTDLIVAHNALFDRPFFEKRFTISSLQTLPWACSFKEVPWSYLGFPGAKLEYLATHLGYFYGAHRAYVDCLALLWILYTCKESFPHLITSARKSSFKVTVKGNTFSINNDLKRIGFRFDGFDKSWYKFVNSKEEADSLKDTLETTYKDGSVNFDVIFKEFTARNRYKF